jgi:excisionase family DNA binding protein
VVWHSHVPLAKVSGKGKGIEMKVMKTKLIDWGASVVTPGCDRLISKREVAGILGVSVRTVERMVSASEIAVIKVRGAVRLRLSDVLKQAGIKSELNPSRV